MRGVTERSSGSPTRPSCWALSTADHLLLGVAHPATGADIWPRLAVDAAALHDALERALVGGVWPPAPTDVPAASVRPAPVDVLLDESARRAVEYAAAEARRLRHPDVRPEHLLLGALRVGQARGQAPRKPGLPRAWPNIGVTLAVVFAALLAADAASGTGRYAPHPQNWNPT